MRWQTCPDWRCHSCRCSRALHRFLHPFKAARVQIWRSLRLSLQAFAHMFPARHLSQVCLPSEPTVHAMTLSL